MSEASLIDRLEPGDHVCWTFDDERVRDAALTAYVRGAVPAEHKVMYLAHTVSPTRVLAGLDAAGVDVATLTDTGQLEVHGASERYLGPGGFDPEAVIATCFDACDRARAEGFRGVRLAGDMAWAAEPDAGTERLSWYEGQVNQVYVDGYAMGLCLYDARLFPSSWMRPILAVHPTAVDRSTEETWSPLLRIRRIEGGRGLRLHGETDLSNREAVVAMLQTLPAAQERAVVDVAGLEFADLGTAHAILMTATRLGGLRLVGVRPQFDRLLDFLGADQVPGLTVECAAAGAGR